MNKILSIQDLFIRNKQKTIIENISFSIYEGEVILISGSNGIGKSTILKSILGLETEGKEISGKIISLKHGNILSMSLKEMQKYRSIVAYVSQKDEYSEMGNIRVRDIISDSSKAYSGKSLSNSEVNAIIDKWIPRRSDGTRLFDALSKPRRFSGGEQRLLSVLSAIATRPNADLYIIDEPLNNLDFVNAKIISNMINKVIHENSKVGIILISHCRIFPFINHEINITSNGVTDLGDSYVWHSCLGEPDENGYY